MPTLEVEAAQQALARPDFDFVQGPAEVRKLRAALQRIKKAPVLGVDTETTGLDPHLNQVRLIQLGTKDFALIVDLDGWRTEGERRVPWEVPGLRELKELLQGNGNKVLQNAAFDLNFLWCEGIVLGGPLFDTMIAAKIMNNGQGWKNDLGAIVHRNLKFELPKELQKANWSGEISAEMLEYAARDVMCLPWLAPRLRDALRGSKPPVQPWSNWTAWDVFSLEMQVLRPVARMQFHGFRFDSAGGRELHQALLAEEERLRGEFLGALDAELRRRHPEDETIWLPREADGGFNTRVKDVGSIRLGTKKYAGFNPRSTQQMAQRFEQAGILVPFDGKGKPSLDQNLLAFLRQDYELIDQYLTWKEAATEVSSVETLLDAVGPDGRIHAGYRQMGTETGRLSCSGPNLQQVNRDPKFRSKFVADPGYVLVVADFSQIELRVAAELSGEERMLEAYRAGRDLHTETAALMTGVELSKVSKAQRTSAKVANFGLLYGAGAATLRKQAMSQYGIYMELKEAKEIVEGFRQAYPRLYEWQMEEGNGTTAAVFTAYGRRRFLVGFNDKYTTRINTQVQGTAGDIAKRAIMLFDEQRRKGPADDARLIAMVHDEIVLEVRENAVEHWQGVLQQCMVQAGAELCKQVPIEAGISAGPTWADAK